MLLARDIMQASPLAVTPATTLADLEDFLVEHRVTGVAVTEGDHLIGVVSRSDVVRSLTLGHALGGFLAEGLAESELPGGRAAPPSPLPPELTQRLAGTQVRDVMTDQPLTVTPDTPVGAVAGTMHARRVHRIFVVEDEALIGVITTLDLVRLIAERRLREP